VRARVWDIARSKAVLFVVALALPAALVAAVVVRSLDEGGTQPRQRSAAQDAPQRGSSFLARLIPPPAQARHAGPRVASSVSQLARRLPVERKVAQLFLLGFRGQDLTAPIFADLRELDLGGIVVDAPNYTGADQLAALAGEAGVIAEQEGHVAPWVIAPQEGGEANAFADLPPGSAPADLRSNAEAFDQAEQAAATLRGLGIDGVLAPVIDVAPRDSVALGPRSYSDDATEVASYARAVVAAYRSARVLTAAGHFPGLGAGTEDTRLGVAQVGSTLDQLRKRDLVPFRAAIRAGVPAVVMSHGLYATDDFVTPASLSRALTTGLLRDDLGFEGIAITDDLADPPITALTSIPDAAVRAIGAGADLLYISGPPEEQHAAYAAVLRAVRGGDIPAARLNEAVLRNLAVKRDYGLIE
jgi:beta-N-acetylhexosaminidase